MCKNLKVQICNKRNFSFVNPPPGPIFEDKAFLSSFLLSMRFGLSNTAQRFFDIFNQHGVSALENVKNHKVQICNKRNFSFLNPPPGPIFEDRASGLRFPLSMMYGLSNTAWWFLKIFHQHGVITLEKVKKTLYDKRHFSTLVPPPDPIINSWAFWSSCPLTMVDGLPKIPGPKRKHWDGFELWPL